MKQEKKEHKLEFLGEFELTVMDDGRIRLPSKVRTLLDKHKIKKLRPTILPNEKAIALCPEQFWPKWIEKLFREDSSHSTFQKERRYLTPSTPLGWDKNGRIYIPKSLSKYAGIPPGKTVIIAALTNHLEIWEENEYLKNF